MTDDEINAEVAEKVMRWRRARSEVDDDRWPIWIDQNNLHVEADFISSKAPALLVVERLHDEGYDWGLERGRVDQSPLGRKAFYAWFACHSAIDASTGVAAVVDVYEAFEATIERAVCVAALRLRYGTT